MYSRFCSKRSVRSHGDFFYSLCSERLHLHSPLFHSLLICRQPTDITEEVTYTKGLRLTRGTEVSSKVGISTSLELAVGIGPFSASVSTTITAEIQEINTASAESSWSVQTKTTRVFPANQDCRLYQRRIDYLTDIQTDELTQTPADFKMVCKPLRNQEWVDLLDRFLGDFGRGRKISLGN